MRALGNVGLVKHSLYPVHSILFTSLLAKVQSTRHKLFCSCTFIWTLLIFIFISILCIPIKILFCGSRTQELYSEESTLHSLSKESVPL